ncbi:MAG: LacI family DNA-binding transcriptional regulator [Firmicutes bacterium]|nr:LacI family DNA-binding transcriptional regulator [Bacillota bacterium]
MSPATVSRAISGRGYVRRELRERILELAKEMDYQPNSLARGLISKQSYTIGLVLSLSVDLVRTRIKPEKFFLGMYILPLQPQILEFIGR